MICVFISNSIWGQIREVRNVPTPEVSNLGTFGSIPVGHYTGTPNISVPLYTMTVGKMSIPIQAMYHTANVKPHIPPTCLGIGWALSAGGYISRSVKGCQDEKQTYSSQAGFYNNYNKLEVIDASPNQAQQLQQFTHLSGNDWYELSADEFSFNFNGYSGIFFMDKEGQWRVISDDNIKVEFNQGNGFIDIDTLKARLKQRYKYNNNSILSSYNSSLNQRFFDKFTLITPDGTRYEFGGGNATEYSVPYYNQVNGDIIATCWRLSKITTTDQRVVTFEYAADSFMCDIHYAPQRITYYQASASAGEEQNSGRTGYSGFLMMPSRLTKIYSDDESICFNYIRNSNYGQLFLHNSKCLYWIDNGTYFDENSRYMYGGLSGYLNANRFSLFLGVSPLSSTDNIQEAIAEKITQDYLQSITIRKANVKIQNIDFVFNTIVGRKLLSAIRFYQQESFINVDDEIVDPLLPSGNMLTSMYSNNLQEPFVHNSEILPDNPIEMGGSAKEYEYGFDYYLNGNQDELWPNRIPLTYTDSWGYYSRSGSNSKNHGEWAYSKNYSSSEIGIRPASISTTKDFVLKSIIYPTGGKTVFDYELNDYSKEFNLKTYSLNEVSGESGGLRVTSIKNYDASGSALYSKNYIYKENGKSTGVSKGAPCFHDRFYFNIDKTDFIDFFSFDDINPYPMNFNTPSVGYSTVYEELRDKNGNLLSSTKYQYTNYDTDINQKSHKDTCATYTANVYDTYVSAAFTSLAFERGKLVSKEVMDDQGHVIEKTTFNYVRSSGAPCSTVAQEWHLDCYNNLFAFSYMYKTYTNRYLVSVNKREETMSNGKYITEQRYEYNNYGLPAKKTIISNNGERHETSYSYNTDYQGSKNIILPAEVEERKGNGISNIVYHYDDSNMGVPYVSKQESLWSYANYGSSPFKVRTDYTVDRVDQYGNPIIWNQQGVKTVMVLSFKGQRLIASIQKASCDEVVAALGKNPEEYSALNNTTLSLDFLRTALPNALVYTYQYDNRLNLISKTDPNGLIHTYTYDSLNRLTSEYRKYNNKTELLKTYQYKYKTK